MLQLSVSFIGNSTRRRGPGMPTGAEPARGSAQASCTLRVEIREPSSCSSHVWSQEARPHSFPVQELGVCSILLGHEKYPGNLESRG